jgi:hypothetical protein
MAAGNSLAPKEKPSAALALRRGGACLAPPKRFGNRTTPPAQLWCKLSLAIVTNPSLTRLHLPPRALADVGGLLDRGAFSVPRLEHTLTIGDGKAPSRPRGPVVLTHRLPRCARGPLLQGPRHGSGAPASERSWDSGLAIQQPEKAQRFPRRAGATQLQNKTGYQGQGVGAKALASQCVRRTALASFL